MAPLIIPLDVRQNCTLSVFEFLGLSLFCTLGVDGLISEILGDVEGMLYFIKLTSFLTTCMSCSNFETSKCSYDKGGRLPKSLATYTGIIVVSSSSIM